MVRRQNNTLSWFQKGAGKITVSKEEPGFNAAVATEDLQIAADKANYHAEDLYLKDLAAQQVSVDASHPVDHIPVKPLYTTVSDPVMDRSGNVATGVQTKTTWPEPLPELIPKRVFKSGASAATEDPIIVAGK